MNKICKEYISDAKKFFPIMGKNERGYLRGIISELEDCIERESITTKQELYVKYRQPYDLANDYYSRFETDEIVKQIRIAKYIKAFISVLIVIVLIVFTFYIFVWNNHRDMALREEMVDTEEYNLESATEHPNGYTIHNNIQSEGFVTDNNTIYEDETIS